MVGQAIDSNAANDQSYFRQIVDFRREVTQNVAGDMDGDGRYSIAELADRDGDGKISMAEYAQMHNNRSKTESHAAASVGASEKVRMGWSKLREARASGNFVPTIAERARVAEDKMHYNPRSGGWQSSARTWGGPGPSSTAPGVGNRNVSPPKANPFDGRQSIFDVAQEARKQELRGYFERQFAGRPTDPMP